ncbi:Crp/Fnr family transcriptional regulator [Desulfohalovibrio reitneri]|uniref:Crp/Fnr family transcriptional regulator n=1 Tax=Desulfohalovibrio reitneri TaxID=1307759 RepID=UPI0004A6CA7D|nr:Crp/Fnr family transcriptional regulator [Desulfohalovibrio reitneri]
MKSRLMDINLLDELARPEFEGLRRELTSRSFLAGQVISSPHSHHNSVFVVASGRARVFLAYDDKEFTLCFLEPGDVYTTHTRAHVVALEPLTLWLVDTNRFKILLQDHPHLPRTMVLVLGDILKSTFSIINSLAFKDIPRRVAEFVVYAARNQGTPSDDGVLVRFDLTTQQLASIVGSSRQSVSETLSRLEREGWIRRHGRGVYLVPDVDALERTANDL